MYSNGGAPIWDSSSYSDPGITRIQNPIRGTRGPEEKAARKFVEFTNILAFDANLFAYCVVQFAGAGMRNRVMSIVKALINVYADSYDVGMLDDDTRDAKRLQDTMKKFKMEG